MNMAKEQPVEGEVIAPANDTTTLITVESLSPYNANEVFTTSTEEAEVLLATKKVEKYDSNNKDHVAALEAQRGKPVDAE